MKSNRSTPSSLQGALVLSTHCSVIPWEVCELYGRGSYTYILPHYSIGNEDRREELSNRCQWLGEGRSAGVLKLFCHFSQ